MKIALAQTRAIKGDIEKNIVNHKKWIEKAVAKSADLIVFPELSVTGFEPKLANELASDQNDERFDEFQVLSNTNKITICVGMPTTSPNGNLISMIIFQPDLPRQTYSKQRLHKDELPFFIEGDDQLILSFNGEKVAPAICYESLQPDHASHAKELGATVYLASVAKPENGIKKAMDHFPKLAGQHSIPVLMANCIGFCDNFESTGQSAVWNTQGELIGQLDPKKEGLLVFDTESRKLV